MVEGLGQITSSSLDWCRCMRTPRFPLLACSARYAAHAAAMTAVKAYARKKEEIKNHVRPRLWSIETSNLPASEACSTGSQVINLVVNPPWGHQKPLRAAHGWSVSEKWFPALFKLASFLRLLGVLHDIRTWKQRVQNRFHPLPKGSSGAPNVGSEARCRWRWLR